MKPLTSASDLPNHPRLSRGFDPHPIQELIRRAETTLHAEQKKLRNLEDKFIELRGDLPWVPVGEMHTAYDDHLRNSVFDGTVLQGGLAMIGDEGLEEYTPSAGRASRSQSDAGAAAQQSEPAPVAQDIEMTDHDPQSTTQASPPTANGNAKGDKSPLQNGTNGINHDAETNGAGPSEPTNHSSSSATIVSNSIAVLPPSPTQNSPGIHPYFEHPLPPPLPALAPDVDPFPLLLSYVSKQKEVIRQWEMLHHNLLRARRFQRNILRWCKAEAHVGEMSDGEDWVDLEEWGLREDELKKGRDEEDEARDEGRKRGRRGAA